MSWDSPKSPGRSGGHNYSRTCPNGTTKVSIGIYATSRCRWTAHSMDLEPYQGRYGRLKLRDRVGQALGAPTAGRWVLFQNKSVSWKSLSATGPGGLPNPTESTMRRGGLPPHSPSVCPNVSVPGVPMGVARGGASPWGLQDPCGAGEVAGLYAMSRRVPGCAAAAVPALGW